MGCVLATFLILHYIGHYYQLYIAYSSCMLVPYNVSISLCFCYHIQLPLEDQLKQQSKEQAQILEVKLKKQSEDQSKHLELQGEEQGKKLEEKLQKQSEEQIQILEAKLKDQSVEQGKKMEEIDLKMQQKGEEQVQRLEAMLQEQASKTESHIRQLAGEVASMKETVEELLKKLVSK